MIYTLMKSFQTPHPTSAVSAMMGHVSTDDMHVSTDDVSALMIHVSIYNTPQD